MFRTFNMGVGMVIVVPQGEKDKARQRGSAMGGLAGPAACALVLVPACDWCAGARQSC